MRVQTGWYSKDKFFVVKPLQNGCRQSLIMWAQHDGGGRWYIAAGVFSSCATYNSMSRSDVWDTPTSTNKNPSIKTVSLALEALEEIEEEIHFYACGKRALIYVDGLDERRLRVYTKILTKKCGYKISTAKSENVAGMPLIYKRV